MTITDNTILLTQILKDTSNCINNIDLKRCTYMRGKYLKNFLFREKIIHDKQDVRCIFAYNKEPR